MARFITVSLLGEDDVVDINIDKILYIRGNRVYFESVVSYEDGSDFFGYVDLDEDGMKKLYGYLEWLDVDE